MDKHYTNTLQIAMELGISHSMVLDAVDFVRKRLNMENSEHFSPSTFKSCGKNQQLYALTRKGYHLFMKYGYLPNNEGVTND